MADYLPNVLVPLLILVLVPVLIVRLRLFAVSEMRGRYPFLSGGICIFLASLGQTLKILPSFEDWFVLSAYPILNLIQFLLLTGGAVLITVGLVLYGDFWQGRREQIEMRESKLSILENLQHDARQPYQLLELLNISLREYLYHLPGCVGAVFLMNRRRRQFVLASSSGLTKKETSLLEYYPLERNVASQAIELGDPLIGGEFSFVNRDGSLTDSRFKSCLALPMLSGMEKIGAFLLLSEEERFFGQRDIRYLAPATEWLAEKVLSTKLGRELSLTRAKVEGLDVEQATLVSRIVVAVEALLSPDAADGFCRSLVGLAGSESVHLIGMRQSGLDFLGGSEPVPDLSENYRTALVDAMDRTKPLIINQETTNDTGETEIVVSSLVVPGGSQEGHEVLLLRRSSTAFKIDDRQLKLLTIYSQLGRIVRMQDDNQRLSITRRKGFDVVLRLLKVDSDVSLGDDPEYFMDQLASVLPPSAVAITFGKEENGVMSVVGSRRADPGILAEFSVRRGEGELGRAATDGVCRFVFGRTDIAASLQEYEIHNRNSYQRLMGERGTPSLMAFCPVSGPEGVSSIVVLLIYDLEKSQRREWERLLTLASGLYSLRLAMGRLLARPQDATEEAEGPSAPGSSVNRLRNHLSAIIGQAELAGHAANIPESLRLKLQEITLQAEQAGDCVQEALREPSVSAAEDSRLTKTSLNAVIRSTLSENHISGNLYMLAERPRELDLRLDAIGELDYPARELGGLLESALDWFGRVAGDRDIISVVAYQRQRHLFVDLSRHRKNFPPVERVAEYGQYLNADKALQNRPSDSFLKHAVGKNCEYTVDRENPSPTYLSFKFPASGVVDEFSEPDKKRPVRLLAVDDQSVILELISALGQSAGYEVDSALLGEEGVQLARQQKYDLVLTDLAMPDISGLEVARRIHALQPDIPIVLVTGWEADLDPAQLESAGIRDVLHKPFRIERLTEIITASLSKPVE